MDEISGLLLEHHIGQFDRLLRNAADTLIPHIVDGINERSTEKRIVLEGQGFYPGTVPSYGSFILYQEALTPAFHERNKFTYGVNADLKFSIRNASNNDRNIIVSFKMPIMVKTEICRGYMQNVTGIEKRVYDADIGAHFIIKGNKYAIVSQIAPATNNLTVTKDNKLILPVQLPDAIKDRPTLSYTLKFCAPTSTILWNATVSFGAKSTSFLKVVGMLQSKKYPLIALLNHHSISRDDLMSMMLGDLQQADAEAEAEIPFWSREHVVSSIDKLYGDMSASGDASNMNIGNLLAHLEDAETKKLTLMHMVRQLLLVMHGALPADNPDLLKHQRVSAAGDLYRRIFESALKRFFLVVIKDPNPNTAAEREVGKISAALEHAIQSGDWSGNGSRSSKSKVVGNTSLVDNTNLISQLANKRRIRSISTHSKGASNIVSLRLIQADYPGRFCLVETPTGKDAGLVRYMALGARITCPTSASYSQTMVTKWFNNRFPASASASESASASASASVWINGTLQTASFPRSSVDSIIDDFRVWRHMKIIDASIEWIPVSNQLHIRTDGGRLVRQLRHIRRGRIEWIDPAEELRMRRVALSSETVGDADYQAPCEDLLLGVTASMKPFMAHSHGPRLVFQCSQLKQSSPGLNLAANRNVVPSNANFLVYPSVPLVRTVGATAINRSLHGAAEAGGIDCTGFMCTVIFNSYQGSNQEDSIVINRAALERGGIGCIVSHSTHSAELETDKKKIKEVCERSKARSHMVEEDGLPSVGAWSKADSPFLIIGKDGLHERYNTGPVRSVNEKRVAVSHVQRPIPGHTVHANVGVRKIKMADIGDKFVAKGQKATVGRIVNEEDMPYTKDGLKPDIIFNSESLPTRMTMDLLRECLLNKQIAVEGGESIVISSFSDAANIPISVPSKEVFYDGITGMQIQSEIFSGLLYFQRLKHIASEKIILRGPGGNMDAITHQPAKGRRTNGGVAHSTMDNWCLLAHGAYDHLQEVNKCDSSVLRYDAESGFISSSSNFTKTAPYSLQILMHELMCLRIVPQIS
jgi:DNA-directed RNA polymerase beta subunit